MTIYEQIQNSVDFIEKNLFKKLSYNQVASSVFMSPRSFYNYFWCITGYTYKEYVIKRRLSEAADLLSNTGDNILEIALNTGYDSHEAFTRAFKREFGKTPVQFRKEYQITKGLNKIYLFKEIYMGTLVKELPAMKVISFEGFAPDPENKAKAKMNNWLKTNHYDKPYRIFGHNIDLEGNLSHNPQNIGYKFMVTVNNDYQADSSVKMEVIKGGKFIVTGVEGNIELDGRWITEGWGRLNKMIADGSYKVKKTPRWFEEELIPSKPGNLRLDLYLEIE